MNMGIKMTDFENPSNESRLVGAMGYLNTGRLDLLPLCFFAVLSSKTVLLVPEPLKPMTLPSTVVPDHLYCKVSTIGLPVIKTSTRPPDTSKNLNKFAMVYLAALRMESNNALLMRRPAFLPMCPCPSLVSMPLTSLGSEAEFLF